MINSIIIRFSLIFCLLSVLVTAWWYSKRQATTLKVTLLTLWQEGIVEGFNDLRVKFIPAAKAVIVTLWDCSNQIFDVVVRLLRPEPVKHVFTPDLYYGLQTAISGYVYAPFQPVIDVVYRPLPSYVYVALYSKSVITEEIKAEIVWALTAKFREYLTFYGFNFQLHAVPYVQDNHIEVYLYYCEFPAEFPAFQARCKQIMCMIADPAVKPLTEDELPKTSGGLVLGYSYDKWAATGQVVPIPWDIATAPHIMISGPTGGGKTVYIKALLVQLLATGASVCVCDFKGHNDLQGFVKDFAVGTDCDTLLARFCSDFEQVREQVKSDGTHRVLVFDEFGSYAATKEKKEFDALMKMISNIIFMGRSYGYSIILIAQRFDAETLKTSLREQFGVKVYMGSTISQQSATMLFPNSDLDKSHRLPPCCGYISTPKADLTTIIIPRVDVPSLDCRLRALGGMASE